MFLLQLLDGIIPRFQLNMGGFGFASALAIPYAIYSKPSFRMPWIVGVYLVLLGLTLYAQNITYFAATLYIPVGTNHSLNKVTSIMVTLVIAHIRWKMQGVLKKMDLFLDLLAALTMVTGILLVIQPVFLFPNNEPLDTEIKSFCNPGRLISAESECIFTVNKTETDNGTMEDTDCLSDSPTTDNSRPAWIGYLIGITSGLLSTSKVFLLQAIFKHIKLGQVMVFVPTFAFVLSSITAFSTEEFHGVDGWMCIMLLICNFIGSMGAHVGFFLVMAYGMPSTDYTIVSCLASVMLMIFQFTVLTQFVPTRTDPVAISGAVVISITAIGKPFLHRWVSSKNQ